MTREREYHGLPGIPVLITLLVAELALIGLLVVTIQDRTPWGIGLTALALAFVTFLMFGHFMVNPNEGNVLQLFGAYKGSAKRQGLRWANPLFTKKAVSPADRSEAARGRAALGGRRSAQSACADRVPAAPRAAGR